MSEQECALWYRTRYGDLDYEIFGTEAETARHAAYMSNYSNGYPVGVQFADGRTVRAADFAAWPAFKVAQEEVRAAEERRAEAFRVDAERPKRQIRDPFEGRALTVDADEPDWLGVAHAGGRMA